jgi:hypothetical protein
MEARGQYQLNYLLLLMLLLLYSAFQMHELHYHNRNLVETLHNNNAKVPTVVERLEFYCNTYYSSPLGVATNQKVNRTA